MIYDIRVGARHSGAVLINNVIYLGCELEEHELLLEKEIENILSHEYIHDILNDLEGYETSLCLDAFSEVT